MPYYCPSGNPQWLPDYSIKTYVIVAQSILEGGSLGRIVEFKQVRDTSAVKALSQFQYDTLRGKGSYLNDDHDTLQYGGIQFTALTDDEFAGAQGDEDAMDGILDLEESLVFAIDPIEERLARLKNPLPSFKVKSEGDIQISLAPDPSFGIGWVAQSKVDDQEVLK